MFDTPDAAPTCFSSTEAVAAEDDGPLDIPIPTAAAITGRTKATYRHELCVRPMAAKPAVLMRKPAPMVCRPPSRWARRGTRGATTTRPTVAGSVASPACSGLNPRADGFWKYRLSRYIRPLIVPAPMRIAIVEPTSI